MTRLVVCRSIVALALFLSSCAGHLSLEEAQRSMESMAGKEQRSNANTRLKNVNFMPLDTLFPDEDTRPLAEAVANGDLNEFKSLLRIGASPKTTGAEGATLLFVALGNYDLFVKLLDLGIDPNKFFGGISVVHAAARMEDPRFLQAALNHGGDPNLRDTNVEGSEPPIFNAIGPWGSNNDKTFDALLNAGADIDFVGDFGLTPALYAAMLNRYDLVMKLLDHGAAFDVEDANGLDLANQISFTRHLDLDTTHPMYAAMEKVEKWLDARGVAIGSWTLREWTFPTKCKGVIYAQRGVRPLGWDKWSTDRYKLLQMEATQFAKAIASAKFGYQQNTCLSFTGHALGGSFAIIQAIVTGGTGTAFDAPEPSIEFAAHVKESSAKQITRYAIDPQTGKASVQRLK